MTAVVETVAVAIEVVVWGNVSSDAAPLPTYVTRSGEHKNVFQPDQIKLTIQRDEHGAELSRRVAITGGRLKADGTPGTRRAQCSLFGVIAPTTPDWAEQWIAEHEHIGGAT